MKNLKIYQLTQAISDERNLILLLGTKKNKKTTPQNKMPRKASSNGPKINTGDDFGGVFTPIKTIFCIEMFDSMRYSLRNNYIYSLAETLCIFKDLFV